MSGSLLWIFLLIVVVSSADTYTAMALWDRGSAEVQRVNFATVNYSAPGSPVAVSQIACTTDTDSIKTMEATAGIHVTINEPPALPPGFPTLYSSYTNEACDTTYFECGVPRNAVYGGMAVNFWSNNVSYSIAYDNDTSQWLLFKQAPYWTYSAVAGAITGLPTVTSGLDSATTCQQNLMYVLYPDGKVYKLDLVTRVATVCEKITTALANSPSNTNKRWSGIVYDPDTTTFILTRTDKSATTVGEAFIGYRDEHPAWILATTAVHFRILYSRDFSSAACSATPQPSDFCTVLSSSESSSSDSLSSSSSQSLSSSESSSSYSLSSSQSLSSSGSSHSFSSSQSSSSSRSLSSSMSSSSASISSSLSLSSSQSESLSSSSLSESLSLSSSWSTSSSVSESTSVSQSISRSSSGSRSDSLSQSLSESSSASDSTSQSVSTSESVSRSSSDSSQSDSSSTSQSYSSSHSQSISHSYSVSQSSSASLSSSHSLSQSSSLSESQSSPSLSFSSSSSKSIASSSEESLLDPSRSSSDHKKKSHAGAAVGAVFIVLVFGACTGACIFFVLWRRRSLPDSIEEKIDKLPEVPAPIARIGFVAALLQRSERGDNEAHDEHAAAEMSSSLVKLSPLCRFDKNIDLTGCRQVPADSFDLMVTPNRKLEFDLGSRQAPVGAELVDTITLCNNYRRAVEFKVVSPQSHQYKISIDPPTGFLKEGEECTIELKMTVLCTTKIDTDVIVTARRDKSDRAQTYIVVKINTSSMLSTSIDPDDLMLGNQIGEGAYGIVYLGKWREQEVAIKVVKNQEGKNATTEFYTEVQMMESIRCPQIVNFVGAVKIPGRLALVTEYFPYGSLKSAMKKHPFPYELKVKCLLDCARGMKFLHQASVLHRDLKPDNLLVLTLDACPVNCKITDFGTSRDVNHVKETQCYTTGVGTPVYMPPELLSSGKYNKSADVYSFAILGHEVLTGEEPFSSLRQSLWKVTEYVISGNRLPLDNLTAGMASLISSCWAQDYHERPAFEALCPLLEQEWSLAQTSTLTTPTTITTTTTSTITPVDRQPADSTTNNQN
ncbi:tyrosine protein kinase [Pelomyxa schiedti]|nr:tyrosine protein kinase [Pelomyxa schiedti]